MNTVEPHVVAVDDNGIRPAGKPDECFYCNQTIGEKHKFDCVTVKSERIYGVWLDDVNVGAWTTDDPTSWDMEMREFHKNDSSWCADNMRHDGKLNLKEGVELPPDDEEAADYRCLCARVRLVPLDD